MIPLYEVPAEVCLADLLHVSHADVQQIIPEEPHRRAHGVPVQQDAVSRERRRGDIVPHHCAKFLPTQKVWRLKYREAGMQRRLKRDLGTGEVRYNGDKGSEEAGGC